VAVADLDGDTAPDLVTANWISDNVTVYLNQRVPVAHPEIDINPRFALCADPPSRHAGGCVKLRSDSADSALTFRSSPLPI
ncbi:MAG: hypothetical protein IH827_10435, partial [Myxococcales bacterium]|nr:hypothetical protein [Myxococcales bacterium]